MKILKIAVSVLALIAYNLIALLLIPRTLTGADAIALGFANLCLIGAAVLWFFTDRTRAVSAASVSLCAWTGAVLVCGVSLLLMLLEVSLRSAGLTAGIALCIWSAAVLVALQVCVPRVGGNAGRVIPPAGRPVPGQTGEPVRNLPLHRCGRDDTVTFSELMNGTRPASPTCTGTGGRRPKLG